MRRGFLKKFFALVFFAVILTAIGISFRAAADPSESKPPLQTITAYTTLPVETVSVLSQAYESENRVRVNFVPMSPDETLTRLDEISAGNILEEKVDLILADRNVLKKANEKNFLRSYISQFNDEVRANFKDENGFWTGTWYDPIVFCANQEYLNETARIPDAWQDLAREESIRIGITDFLSADASANLMFQMISQFGDAAAYQILGSIHPKVVQYAKFLSNPVRQAGMGEVDIAIAVESESVRYMRNGYPVRIIYPTDGTGYMLYGTAVTNLDNDVNANLAAEKFCDWLLSDKAQAVLQQNDFYFISTNPSTIAYKTFAGKNLVLFEQLPEFSKEEENAFLDHWVKEIRFKSL